MSRKLDKIDLKIIQSLSKHTRKPTTELAKDVGISRPTAINRLRRMVEENVLRIDVGINIKKLGFRVACVGLEVKGINLKREVEERLLKCPRVLMLLCPSEKVNLSVYLFGEDQETLRSVIESIREFPGVEIVYAFHSEPPLYPEAFPLRLNLRQGSLAPCGLRCCDCLNYKHGFCVGCPAVDEYKGPLST